MSWPTPGRHALHTTIGHSRDDSARVHVEEYMVCFKCVCMCVCTCTVDREIFVLKIFCV